MDTKYKEYIVKNYSTALTIILQEKVTVNNKK